MNETVDCAVLKKKFPISLKPCPFCGARPRVMEIADEGYRIWCSCGIETFPVLTKESSASMWNYRFDDDLQKLIEGITDHGDSNDCRAADMNSKIDLKPCPFCGAQPELLPCPNPEDEGYLVRCLFDSCLMVSETVLQPTVEAATDAWNTRYCEQLPATGLFSLFPSYLWNAPFAMYVFGSLVSSIGMGLREGFPWFLSALGVCSVAGALAVVCFADLAADKSKKAKAGRKWCE